jgi:hypothetical protein
MTSWLVWIVIATIAVFLTAIGYWFSVRTLRIVTLIIALVLLVVITRYGLTRPAKTPPDLANSFTRGADALSVAFFRPLLALVGNVPAPGRVGWLVIAIAIIIGYRQLEAWVIRRQAPTLDMSALGDGQPDSQPGSPQAGPGDSAPGGRPGNGRTEPCRTRGRSEVPAGRDGTAGPGDPARRQQDGGPGLRRAVKWHLRRRPGRRAHPVFRDAMAHPAPAPAPALDRTHGR